MKSIIGQLLNGRYLVVRQLQQKSLHIAYLAEDQHKLEHGICLVKQYKLSNIRGINNFHASRQFNSFLFQEIQQLRQFNNSPQIPAVLDYFLWREEFYFIREFIPGDTLEEEISTRRLEESEVLHLIKQSLAVLEIIHQADRKHLNLKPSNLIFATSSPDLYVTDFDNLKYLLQDKIVQSEILAATSNDNHYYLAPEQKMGNPTISSDFYSLGVIAIRALTGKYPHEVKLSDLDNYARASIIDLETSETINISSKLAKVIQNLLNHDPQSRYQSTQDILQALAKSENVVVLPSPHIIVPEYQTGNILVASLPRKQKKRKKFKLLPLILGLLATLSSIAFGLIYLSKTNINPKQNFVEYRNENYGITLDYPQEWQVRELEDPITGEIAVFTSPLENESDLFQEQIYLSIDNLSVSPEESIDITLDRIKNNSNISDITYAQKSINVNNESVKTIAYQRNEGVINLQQKEVFIAKQGQVYLITFVAEKKDYEELLEIANIVITSFTQEN